MIVPRPARATEPLRRLHAVASEIATVRAELREVDAATGRRLRAYLRMLRAERNKLAVAVLVQR